MTGFWKPRLHSVAGLTVVAILTAAAMAAPAAKAGTLPSGFQETTAFDDLVGPTAMAFSPDGRIFVAEKSGRIEVFDSLSDPTPTVFADLRTEVYNAWDRGLLGLALDPNFPQDPYVYVLYTLDAPVGGTPPVWGGGSDEGCPDPPGFTDDGCVVSGRISRLTASGNAMVGNEDVLIEDWCQQYPSHSVGDLEFGPDGKLYASGGEGASFTFTDYGQRGDPQVNPCGDPPGGVGDDLSPPTAEGGSLRSQDVRTSGDPTGLDGSIIRVNTDGSPASGNPLSGDANARRIIAYGLRNPFRFTFRPGADELWVGDVGENVTEEMDRMSSLTEGSNFGWPCYEGVPRHTSFDVADLDLCESLYTAGTAIGPYYAYAHSQHVVPGETCPTSANGPGSSITGLAFEDGSAHPASYDGALFFADFSRNCIWVMKAGVNGLPDANKIQVFDPGAPNPVQLKIGPDGALYYANLGDTFSADGSIQRVAYFAPGQNQPPIAIARADHTFGKLPLKVQFDGTHSSDADGSIKSYAWDLDGDGQYDDSNSATPTRTYNAPGNHVVGLRVKDNDGSAAKAAVTINAGDTPPNPVIDTPASGFRWRVGQNIHLTGHATDAQDGTLADSQLDWSVILRHCPSGCHSHGVTAFHGTADATFPAPDHDYPSHLVVKLTATDLDGLSRTTSRRLDPRTVNLTLAASKPGLKLDVGAVQRAAPFTTQVIKGSTQTISAPSPQTLNGVTYNWASWSDAGSRTHEVVTDADATYTASYTHSP